MYVTQRGLLGFRVIDMRRGNTAYVVHFKGFTWNPSSGRIRRARTVARTRPPGALGARRAKHTLHVFDVSEVPRRRRATSTDAARDARSRARLAHAKRGRALLYVGGAGDVIDTQTRTSIATWTRSQHASTVLEVDWIGGRPVFPGFPR
jgi:hypothetical protein